MQKKSFSIPSDVVPLVAEFNKWRKDRPSPRSRLPQNLMAKAIAAARIHSARVIARSVGLEVRQLTKAVRQISSPVVVQSSKANPPTTVRLAPVIGLQRTPSSVMIEIEAPTGWRLRVSGSGGESAVKTFMEALV